MRTTLAIDPGVTGAVAWLRDGVYAGVADLPIHVHGKTKILDGPKFLQLLTGAGIFESPDPFAFIEHVHAMPPRRKPGQQGRPVSGTKTADSIGCSRGSVMQALLIAGIPFDFVEPNSWKRALKLTAPGATDKERKNASLCRARELCHGARPQLERQKDHNRAEAILIGVYSDRLRVQKGMLRQARGVNSQIDLVSGAA